MSVSIAGIDKVSLLKALWENSKPAVFYKMQGLPPPDWSQVEAEKAVLQSIDYFRGRCIKSDLSGDTALPHGYDRDYGQGKFAEIVTKVKSASA